MVSRTSLGFSPLGRQGEEEKVQLAKTIEQVIEYYLSKEREVTTMHCQAWIQVFAKYIGGALLLLIMKLLCLLHILKEQRNRILRSFLLQ